MVTVPTSGRALAWVLLGWLAVVVTLNVAVPQLEELVAKDSTPVIPEDAAAVEGFAEMDREFGNGRSKSVLFVVAERDGGLAPTDVHYLRGLVPRLRHEREHVSFVQDVQRRPELLRALRSKDGEAAYLQVGIPGATGAPSSIKQVDAVRDVVRDDAPEGLDVAVTGPTATIADMATEVEHSLVRITAVTIVVIGLILLVMYRSIPVTALVLTFIGLSLATARGLTALAGQEGLFNVSTFTGSFLTGVTLGAATDYAIFMISRFHELRREGFAPIAAVTEATGKVRAVILGSAGTVIVASSCMALAHLGIFNTTGPAIALSIAGTLTLCLTLLPAMMVLVGRTGRLDPRVLRDGAGWRRVAETVVRRPGAVLAAGLVPLLLLAAFYPALQPSFDERSGQPDDTESNRGYDLIEAHYPANEVLADFVLVQADHDLRNARDLAALEQAAGTVARTSGVDLVRGVTRPLGRPIAQASLGNQMGRVGSRLGDAEEGLTAGQEGVARLTSGADQLDDGASTLAAGADRAAAGAGSAADGATRLVAGVSDLHDGLQRLAAGTGSARSGSARLRDGADALASGLESAATQTQAAVDGLALIHDALTTKSLTCGLDPACRKAREGIHLIYVRQRDELIPGLRRAADAARRIADGTVELGEGLAELEAGMSRAERGAAELAAGQQRLRDGLGRLATGGERLADGSRRLAEGTDRLSDGTEQMSTSVGELRAGLSRASSYLSTTARAAKDPAVGGFYLPPRALDDARFAQAASVFLSPDGHTARLLVIGGTDAFGRAATERADVIRDAAAAGLRGTDLADAAVSTTGIASINGDLDRFSRSDFLLVSAVTLAAVFLILLLVLRGLAVALLLLASVVLSYAAAMGLSVIVWQELLDVPMEWTVPTIAFVLLVSVGADYNLLLMKRMREEAPRGEQAGMAHAAAVSGGVITAAGIIFAASMFALMTGSVVTLKQMGFTVGAGILLDTFVIRTLIVPAAASMIGERLWWPGNRVTAGT